MKQMSNIKLHIGGKQPHPEWKILDIEPRPEVDFVGDAGNLSTFADDSVEMIYASHVLEHFNYNFNNELLNVLKEWRRVLIPQGKLLVSVPDLKVLCWLYSHPTLNAHNRHDLMKMMFGGQANQYDMHKVGFDFETLMMYVTQAGFSHYERVQKFNLFKDCSNYQVFNNLISLNVIITK